MKRIVTLMCIVLTAIAGWAQENKVVSNTQPTNWDYDIVVNTEPLAVPLIVVNGEPFKVTKDFDFANARTEDFAELIGVEPDDIKDITVIKDGAATAIWGERGRWGVIDIKTKGKLKKKESKKKIKMISDTVSDADGPCWMANVVEINEQDSIVGHVATDSLGLFTLKVVNPKDKIRISYIGVKTVEFDINKKKYNIIMQPAKPEMTIEELNEELKRRLR